MNDPEPTRPDFLKTAARSAVRAFQAGTPLPDRTPGIRRERKHKAHGSPASFHGCPCKGCICSRQSRFGLACHACTLGRHAIALVGKAERRRRAGVARTLPRIRVGAPRTPAQRRAAQGRSNVRGQLVSIRG